MSENDALLLRRFADVGDTEAFAAIVRQYARMARNDSRLGRRVHWLAGSHVTFRLNFLRNRVEGLLWTRDECGQVAGLRPDGRFVQEKASTGVIDADKRGEPNEAR